MADTLDILTLPEAYRAANNPSASGHDDEMAQWVTAVSRRIDDACGPVVQRTITDEVHDGGCREIWPRHRPVASVSSVVEFDNTTETVLTAETNASKPDNGYLLDDHGGRFQVIVRRSGNTDSTFPVGRRNVGVTYVAGRYDTTENVDAKFKAAVGAILRRLWSRDAGAWARGSDPFDTGSQMFFDAFKQSMKEYLADEIRVAAVG